MFTLKPWLAVALVSMLSASAQANLITFETLPDGSTPTDNQELTTSYSIDGTTTTFGFDTDDNLAIDVNARLEYRGGSDYISGYLATDHDDADQSSGGVGGEWMLREPGGLNNVAEGGSVINMGTGGGDDFLIVYSGTLANSAAGQIWDWDNNERWLITAFDVSYNIISEIDTGANGDSARGGSYDGRPLEFSFYNLASDIALIRISFTGTSANAGFAFDNFNATENSTAVSDPKPLALMGGSLLLLSLGTRIGRSSLRRMAQPGNRLH